jgi:hypothetical protein
MGTEDDVRDLETEMPQKEGKMPDVLVVAY